MRLKLIPELSEVLLELQQEHKSLLKNAATTSFTQKKGTSASGFEFLEKR